jgi:sugar lactone lactonase YvrE
MIHDTRICELGEGALWHPLREQLFWFDILGKRLLTQDKGQPKEWSFPDRVSAAGWIDRDRLLIASERGLFEFNIETGATAPLAGLEEENSLTRSNDGRADPLGGFWIGTMGKKAETGAGAIYRLYKGEVRRLFGSITIPNATCFSPDGRTAHFADTVAGRVMRVGLDSDGWPKGQPEVYLDLTTQGLNPDGAVIDASGAMWLAQWGAARVAAYDPQGQFLRAINFDAPHTSCPSFGGADLTTLYCTTALEGMDAAARASHPHAGKTFAAPGVAKGQAEHRVIL